MQTRLAKEFHFLLLPILVTLLLPLGVGLIFRPPDEGVVLLAMAFASALVGASVFGREFSHATITQLLAQPVSRLRLWSEKMLTLLIALSPCIGVTLWMELAAADRGANSAIHWLIALFVPLCAICTTPYLALLMRGTLGAVVFSFAIPMSLLGMCSAASDYLESINFLERFNIQSLSRYSVREEVFAFFALAVLSIYCAVFCWLGWRKFKNFQVIEQQPADMRLGNVLEIFVRQTVGILFRDRRSAVRSLVAKELQLQHMTFMLTTVFWTLQAAAVIYLKFAHPPGGEAYWLVPFILHVALVPVVIGGLSVAEERNLGVHGWHLTLPVAVRKQWLIKLTVCLPLSFLLGLALPIMFMHLANGIASEIPGPGKFEFWPTLLICAAQMLVTVVAIYGSSISNNTLRAIVLGLIMAAACGIGAGIVRQWSDSFGPFSIGVWSADQLTSMTVRWIESVAFGGAAVGTIWVLVSTLACAFGNYRRVDVQPRRLWQHALIVFSPVLVIGWLTLLALSFLMRLNG